MSPIGLLSLLGWGVTLGLIPLYQDYPALSKFIVLDKNLNLVKVFTYKSDYTKKTSYFVDTDPPGAKRNYGHNPPEIVIQNDIKEFQYDFISFYNKSQKKE